LGGAEDSSSLESSSDELSCGGFFFAGTLAKSGADSLSLLSSLEELSGEGFFFCGGAPIIIPMPIAGAGAVVTAFESSSSDYI